MDLSYRTVHAAKGLEADYVMVLGVCVGCYGFPSEITDDPLLELVLTKQERHPNAEERRVFYVALTRARRRAYVLEQGGQRSACVEELLDAGRVGVFGEAAAGAVAACPDCGKGRLTLRDGPDGRTFYGCTYFPYCEHKEPSCAACGAGRPAGSEGAIRCLACGHEVEGCGRCNGWLVERPGRYGPFLGCSNYPACRYTSDIADVGGVRGRKEARRDPGHSGSRRRVS